MTDESPDVRSRPAKLPTRLALKDGTETKVEEVCYSFGRGFYRVTYRRSDHTLRGVVAENEGGRFLESSMEDAVREIEDRLGIGHREEAET